MDILRIVVFFAIIGVLKLLFGAKKEKANGEAIGEAFGVAIGEALNFPSSDNPVVQQLLKNNPTCADCTAANPDWVSLNLGVCFCIDCAGVHRSLGVHISKVRSLTLDRLSDSELSLLMELGNEKMNAIYEKEIGKGWTKPKPSDGRKQREIWIRKKYGSVHSNGT